MTDRISNDLELMLGEEVDPTPPQSRIEKILYSMLGYTVEVDPPQSRIEKLLIEVAENMPSPTPSGGDTLGELLTGRLGAYTNNEITAVGDYVFYKKTIGGNLSFPNVTEVDAHAFDELTITSAAPHLIYMPAMYRLVGEGQFNKCNISSVDFPLLTQLGSGLVQNGIFSGCTSLETVRLCSTSHTAVLAPRNFVRNCTSLKTVDGYFSSVTTYAFTGCTALEKIINRAPQMASLANVNALDNTNDAPIYVPDALVNDYKTATNWSIYADRIFPISELGEV